MKKLFAAALFCLSLMGCAQERPPAQPAIPDRLAPTKETENDTLRCYPLDHAECRFFAIGEDLWLVQAGELLSCKGKNLTCSVRRMLPNAQCSLQAAGNLLCCYDPDDPSIILMPQDLSCGTRIPLPENIQNTPLLCPEGNHLYYCADDTLMVMDVNSGLHRLLRSEIPEDFQPAAVLEASGTLVCRTGNQSVYISSMDGTQQAVSPTVTAAAVISSRDCLAVQCGAGQSLYLGSTMLTFPLEWHFLAFLPGAHGALVCREAPEPALAIYDLNTGNRIAHLLLGDIPLPSQATITEDGRVFFQPKGTACLYQWFPEFETFRDSSVRVSPVFSSLQPDWKGLEQCRGRSAFIEKQYGLQILLHTDTLRVQPGEYQIEPEYMIPILADTLDRFERALIPLPAEFLRQLFRSQTFLCPVRSIRSPDGQETDALCYRSGESCYLFLAVSDHVETTLLRSLIPLMDAQILTHCDAYDSWEALNPLDFHYGDSTAFDGSAFVCSESTHSPTDDRSELWIAAMESGNRELFTSAILQKKLRLLCTGLRTAFNLPQNSLPWEQYLWEPV